MSTNVSIIIGLGVFAIGCVILSKINSGSKEECQVENVAEEVVNDHSN